MEQKLPYLGIFGLEFEKPIVMFEISYFEFIKNIFLTNIVNFGIDPTFSKGSKSKGSINLQACNFL